MAATLSTPVDPTRAIRGQAPPPPRDPRHLHAPGLGPRDLAAYALLVITLLGAALLVAAPQPLPFLSFMSGSFGVRSQADFDTNPPRRFAPQRAVTQVSQPQS